MALPNQDERRLATVSEILPEFDPATLTLKVRLEVDNPQFALRPGMFVNVEFPINLPASINLPANAILDSGLQQTVFVDQATGGNIRTVAWFEIGWRLGDRVEIIQGLKPGERIVVFRQILTSIPKPGCSRR